MCCPVLSYRGVSCLVLLSLVVALLVFSCFCVVLPGLVSAHLYLSCLLGPVLFYLSCLVLSCLDLSWHASSHLLLSCFLGIINALPSEPGPNPEPSTDSNKARTLSCLLLPHLVLSCVVLYCLIVICPVLSCHPLCHRGVSCLVLCLSCLVVSCLFFTCLVLSCPVLFCRVLSCLVMPCLLLSCLLLSSLVLFFRDHQRSVLQAWPNPQPCTDSNQARILSCRVLLSCLILLPRINALFARHASPNTPR